MTREAQVWVVQAINAERAAKGLTIKALGAAAGIPERTLVRALKCERDLNMEQLAKIAAALGVMPSYLQIEAERRQSRATPQERTAALIQSDDSLTSRQKLTLLGEEDLPPDEVRSDDV